MVPHSQGYRNTFGVSREMGLLTGSVFIADVVSPPSVIWITSLALGLMYSPFPVSSPMSPEPSESRRIRTSTDLECVLS